MVQRARTPSAQQIRWLRRGLEQPGGKLPLFDANGQRVNRQTVESCKSAGWAEVWFHNPLKPDWQVCRLTEAGREALASYHVIRVDFRSGCIISAGAVSS
ncbi:MAG TPA: hypothetical protein VEB64_16160 [Azospirillaceae bacterium]|nr:hypothetical protein [Azospirillaceae bacterium]